jgi:ribonuclease P protein component
MERQYRLRKNVDFQRVRRQGRSWVNKLLVLSAVANDLDRSRFGFSVSRRIGKAVVRNRTKRLMREATRQHQDRIPDGWDVVLIARPPMREAGFPAVERAVEELLRRAHLLPASTSESQETEQFQDTEETLNSS